MARLLIAATPKAADTMNGILAGRHELRMVSTVSEAQASLKQSDFDLIMVDVHFDESRMFELLGELQRKPKDAMAPFICFSVCATPLLRTMRSTIESACSAFGAWMYLDRDAGEITDDSECLRLIERCLAGEERKENFADRIKIHRQREELLQLRLALEGEKWTPDLEDQVSEFRSRLAEVLLALSELQIDNIEIVESIAESTRQEDQVPTPVTNQEKSMERAELKLNLKESEQLGKEQEIIPGEESKSKVGRREQS